MSDTPSDLDERLASLLVDVDPPAALWSRVAAELHPAPPNVRSRSRTGPLALAAGLAGLAVMAGLAWRLGPALTGQAVPPTATVAAQPPVRAPDFGEPQTPEYRRARLAMEQTFRARLTDLDPVTRSKIEASLATIRQAREDIREALATAPADPVLGRLLQSTLTDEFDLFENVVRSTEPNRTRT